MTMSWTAPAWCEACDTVGRNASIVSFARWPDDVAVVREMVEEYVAWLGEAAGVDPAAEQPSMREELDDLERWYTPPEGRMLVARRGMEIVGSAGVHLLDGETAELKRVYVRSSARGERLGRRLVDAAIREARRLGARRLVLETSPGVMPRAYRIYLERGFRPTERYSELEVPGVVAMERPLGLFPNLRSHDVSEARAPRPDFIRRRRRGRRGD
jgi:putative acetyltransferase